MQPELKIDETFLEPRPTPPCHPDPLRYRLDFFVGKPMPTRTFVQSPERGTPSAGRTTVALRMMTTPLTAIVVLWLLPMFVALPVAHARRRMGFPYGFFLGWVGVIVLLVLPAKPNPDVGECPFCRADVRFGATICPHCRSELGQPT